MEVDVGGLLLNLVVVPVVYTFLDDLGGAFVRRWDNKSAVSVQAGSPVEVGK